jgi:hypothetical protein
MTGTVQNLIAKLKRDLDHLYGKRLQGLYLYGSYLSLQYGVSISRVFVNAETWKEPHNGFLSNIRMEAIAA